MKQNRNANSSVFENNTGSVNPSDLANAVNSKLDEKINSGVVASGSELNTVKSQLDEKVNQNLVLTKDKIGFNVDFTNEGIPILTKESVTDRTANGVADPFIVFNEKDGLYHLFFEVITTEEEIGHATSKDGITWAYDRIVLTENGQHFAYPFTFKENGIWYMIPDKGNMLSIYTTSEDNFPYGWTLAKTYNIPAVDFTLWKWHDNRWYAHCREGSVVNLYYANGTDLLNLTWAKHPMSPMINASVLPRLGERGGGNAFIYDNYVLFPIQGMVTTYGEYLKWYALSDLSTTTFTLVEGEKVLEKSHQIKNSSNERYEVGMHHLSHIPNSDGNILIADGLSRTGTDNWCIVAMKKAEKKEILFSSKSWKVDILVKDTWTKLVAFGERFNGHILIDSGCMWNETNKELNIIQDGLYRVRFQVTTYGNRNSRMVKCRLKETTVNDILLQAHRIITQNTTGEITWGESIYSEKMVYLKAGQKIILEVFTNVDGLATLPNEGNTFFEVEKIR
ncbi:MAG: glucosamine inositolphosphorylceramide transferase family protein [Peptostreptococcaceae bacterium]